MAETDHRTTGTVVLGFVQFFRKFIKGFSKIAEPLHALTRKDVSFTWSES